MKKFWSRKRVPVVVILLVAALAAGGTYAWFVASSMANEAEVDLGILDIQGTFGVDVDGVVYQPGDSVDMEGEVKNTGSLALMAKVVLNPKTTLIRDETGALLPGGGKVEITNDPNVTVAYDESTIVSEITADGKVIAWYKHKENPDEYYVVLEAGLETDLEIAAAFAGKGMGNEYMGATVSFGTGWEATQTRDEAIQDMWDVSRHPVNGNLELIPINTGFGLRAFGSDPNEYLMARLDELFA